MPKTFDHTAPSDDQQSRLDMLRGAFIDLEAKLQLWVPPGRELSLAKTKLEELAMWANKGVTRGDAIFKG